MPFLAYSQNEKCNKILEKDFVVSKINENPSEFRNNIFKLFNCSNLSEDDIYTLTNTPILTSILVDISTKNSPKYKDFFNKIITVTKTENFRKIKVRTSIIKNLETKKVAIENWKEDKKMLKSLGIPNKKIEEIYLLVKSNKKDITYKELLEVKTKRETSYITKQPSSKNNVNVIRDYFVKLEDFDFNKIQKEANRAKKPLLLFFTGYACINAIKMEENILSNNKVIKNLKKYYCVALFVDENKELPKNKWIKSKRKNRILKTLGEKASEFQALNFKSNFQPFFAIIKNGKTQRVVGYTGLEGFLKFTR